MYQKALGDNRADLSPCKGLSGGCAEQRDPCGVTMPGQAEGLPVLIGNLHKRAFLPDDLASGVLLDCID